MTTTTPINALPSPDDSSPNDPPIHFNALANQLDTRLVPRFTSTAARDSAIPSPSDGMVCWVGSREYAHVNGAWEAQGRFRGTGTTFPADAINGDYYYHQTYRCFMAYNGNASYWRQMSIAEVSSDSDRSTFLSGLSSAGLQMHNGFQVFQDDTDRLWISPGGTNLQVVNGPASLVVTNPSTGPSGLLTTGAVRQARSIAIPAHTPGKLHMTARAVWSASANAAGVFSLQTPSGTDVPGSPARSKSDNGNSIGVALDGWYWSDGSARTLYLAVNVETNSQPITVEDCAFSVWLH